MNTVYLLVVVCTGSICDRFSPMVWEDQLTTEVCEQYAAKALPDTKLASWYCLTPGTGREQFVLDKFKNLPDRRNKSPYVYCRPKLDGSVICGVM